MAENRNQGNSAAPQDLNQLRKVRREKLANLVAEGKNPFEIVTYDQEQHTKEILDNYEAFEGTIRNSIQKRYLTTMKPSKVRKCPSQDV